MKNVKERILDISTYLNCLTKREVFAEVQSAVEQQNKKALVGICKRMNIPEIYLASIIGLLLSVAPRQKWPAFY